MPMGFSTAIRNAQMDAITTAAGDGAKLRIYSGTQPATGEALDGNTLLAELTCGSPLAPPAEEGVLTFNDVTSDLSAAASGEATWARLTHSDSTFVTDFSVGLPDSGEAIQINNTNITEGQRVDLVSGTIAAGNP